MTTIDDVKQHVDSCRICQQANKRVNDFCPTGKVIFYEFAQVNQPKSIEVLGEEQSKRIIAEETLKAHLANNN